MPNRYALSGSNGRYHTEDAERVCSEDTPTFLDKAADWRRRAEELRTTAERMEAARTSLLERAHAPDRRAQIIERYPRTGRRGQCFSETPSCANPN
jgi:hypothetical protein